MEYRNLNSHSDIELHNRLVHFVKSSNTECYQLTNPSVKPRHLPKFGWLAFAISYFSDAIYIPSCCLAVRCLSQHKALLSHCTAFRYWAAVRGKVRIQVRVLGDSEKREVPCAVWTGIIGAHFVSSFVYNSVFQKPHRYACTITLIYAHTTSRNPNHLSCDVSLGLPR